MSKQQQDNQITSQFGDKIVRRLFDLVKAQIAAEAHPPELGIDVVRKIGALPRNNRDPAKRRQLLRLRSCRCWNYRDRRYVPSTGQQ
jgi:hypothetical protein